jgi:hypothetical protein
VNARHIPASHAFLSVNHLDSQAAILVSHLVRRLPAGKQRLDLAKSIMEACDPLSFGSHVLRWLHTTDDPEKQDRNTLTSDEIHEVRQVLISRVKERVGQEGKGESLDVVREHTLLFDWWRLEGRAPVQSHLTSIFARDPHQIARFLQAIAPRSWGSGDRGPQVGDLRGASLKSIKLIFDLDLLADLIRKNLQGDFENPQWSTDKARGDERRLAEQFMFIYNDWKREGEPPDQPVRGRTSQSTGTAAEDDGGTGQA